MKLQKAVSGHGRDKARERCSGVLDGMFIKFALSLLIVSIVVFSSPGYALAAAYAANPVMRFTDAERALHNQLLLEAPPAILTPQNQKESQFAVIRGSLSLLSRISYVPSERAQGDSGNCWVWAGTGVMEIALNVQRGYTEKLSIQYVDSNYFGVQNGGDRIGLR
jgi:hypothetical protein